MCTCVTSSASMPFGRSCANVATFAAPGALMNVRSIPCPNIATHVAVGWYLSTAKVADGSFTFDSLCNASNSVFPPRSLPTAANKDASTPCAARCHAVFNALPPGC